MFISKVIICHFYSFISTLLSLFETTMSEQAVIEQPVVEQLPVEQQAAELSAKRPIEDEDDEIPDRVTKKVCFDGTVVSVPLVLPCTVFFEAEFEDQDSDKIASAIVSIQAGSNEIANQTLIPMIDGSNELNEKRFCLMVSDALPESHSTYVCVSASVVRTVSAVFDGVNIILKTDGVPTCPSDFEIKHPIDSNLICVEGEDDEDYDDKSDDDSDREEEDEEEDGEIFVVSSL